MGCCGPLIEKQAPQKCRVATSVQARSREMTKNLKIESTDSKADPGAAAFAPYTTVSVTLAEARPPVQCEDGSIEHAEPHV